MRILVAAVAASLMGSTAFAQDSGWQYNLTTYLWATDTGVSAETPSGTVDAELSFSDALKDLDFAFAGTFEARKGKLFFFTDANYVKLSPTSTGPGGEVDVTVRTQMTFISGFAGYRVYEDPSVSVDLAGGFRWINLDSDLSGSEGFVEYSTSDSWSDPVLGIRVSGRISDKMTATLFTDYGGFSGDSSTWQASATVGYDLNDRWTLVGGYRYMEFNREIDGNDFSMDQSGLVVGATYKF